MPHQLLSANALFSSPKATAALLTAFSYVLYRTLVLRRCRPFRPSKLPNIGERVLILGGTSGIGRAIARLYAARGAWVCVVGRREALLKEVEEECRGVAPLNRVEDVLAIQADFAVPKDMVRVRKELLSKWGGLDTLVVSAGVSALQPLLAVAGADMKGTSLSETQTSTEGIQILVDVASAALKGNYIGPLVAAATFTPLLSATSKSPAVLLINSLASVIPAPTRTLYASTKAASLVLYQALSIEHPQIAFTHFLPATVEGDFRASAVDNGPVRELDPNKTGLKRADVARRAVESVDNGEKTVFMPTMMRWAHLLYWIWPAYIEKKAMSKYNFET